MDSTGHKEELTNALVGEIQVVLAEKRTSLAFMRTGIAVFALPLSVLGVLIATSKYYEFSKVLHLIVPLLILCAVLVVLGSYLIVRAVMRVRRYDRVIARIKQEHSILREFLD